MSSETHTIDLNDPVIAKALTLAQELSKYYRENNIPLDLMLDGVTVDCERSCRRIAKESYIEGKAYERGRIAQLLGLL